MTTPLVPFIAQPRKGDAWFFAGLVSSFPNLTESGTDVLDEYRPCGNGESLPGCKVLHVPSDDASQAEQVEVDAIVSCNGLALQDQSLVFRYKGKIHAVDNVSWLHLAEVSMLSCFTEMPSLGVPVSQYDMRNSNPSLLPSLSPRPFS